MAWCGTGDKLLLEPMMTQFIDAYRVALGIKERQLFSVYMICRQIDLLGIRCAIIGYFDKKCKHCLESYFVSNYVMLQMNS